MHDKNISQWDDFESFLLGIICSLSLEKCFIFRIHITNNNHIFGLLEVSVQVFK